VANITLIKYSGLLADLSCGYMMGRQLASSDMSLFSISMAVSTEWLDWCQCLDLKISNKVSSIEGPHLFDGRNSLRIFPVLPLQNKTKKCKALFYTSICLCFLHNRKWRICKLLKLHYWYRYFYLLKILWTTVITET
jgi:hypothetical protein